MVLSHHQHRTQRRLQRTAHELHFLQGFLLQFIRQHKRRYVGEDSQLLASSFDLVHNQVLCIAIVETPFELA